MTERKKYCRSKTNKCYYVVSLFLFIFIGSSIVAQTSAIVQFECKKLPFVHAERNELIGAHSLDSFFHKLYLQKTKNQLQINILHVGDSHIQADLITAQMRNNFQNDFGNAGRGLVVPFRVARTNEPFNYRTSSNIKWASKRCVFTNNPMPIGISGLTIQTDDDSATLSIKTFNSPTNKYDFNKLTLFYQKDSSYNFVIEDTAHNTIGALNHKSVEDFSFISTTLLSNRTNEVILSTVKTDSSQNTATIYGINLENGNNGILYHAIGVNGAEAYQFAEAKYFAQQTAALHPDLFILSFGTNEAQHKPFDSALTESRVDSLVKQLRAVNPTAAIILTTPPDSYYHKKYYNTGVGMMHKVLVDYAKTNGLAIWDLYSITGGYKSCYQWKKYRLMGGDGVHFTRQGYEFQANLLYEAIVKAYNKYVSSH